MKCPPRTLALVKALLQVAPIMVLSGCFNSQMSWKQTSATKSTSTAAVAVSTTTSSSVAAYIPNIPTIVTTYANSIMAVAKTDYSPASTITISNTPAGFSSAGAVNTGLTAPSISGGTSTISGTSATLTGSGGTNTLAINGMPTIHELTQFVDYGFTYISPTGNLSCSLVESLPPPSVPVCVGNTGSIEIYRGDMFNSINWTSATLSQSINMTLQTVPGTSVDSTNLSIGIQGYLFNQISNINNGPGSDGAYVFGNIGSKVYFSASDNAAKERLYVYDINAPTSIRKLSNYNAGSDLVAGGYQGIIFKDALYYACTPAAVGNKRLCKYDPGSDTIYQLTAFNAGTDNIQIAMTSGDLVIFMAYAPGTAFTKLFSYNTATNVIQQISNTNGGSASDNIVDGIDLNGKIYFAATVLTQGTRLLEYDPSTVTLRQLSNITPGAGGDGINKVVASGSGAGSVIYFGAYKGGTAYLKLHKYDPNTDTIQQVSDIVATGDGVANFVPLNGKLYFTANNSSYYPKVFEYDPGVNQIKQISNTKGASFSDTPSGLRAVSSRLFFVASNPTSQSKLYYYDPRLPGNVYQASNTYSGSSDVPTIVLADQTSGRVYFSAFNANGRTKLYMYDPATGYQVMMSETSGSNTVNDSPSAILFHAAPYQSIFFSANNPGGYSKLFELKF